MVSSVLSGKSAPSYLHHGLAAGAALGLAWWIFGLDFLLGTSEFWNMPPGDMSQHLIGYLFYIQDHFRFPLFYVPDLGYPEGGNIIFTDSIPIAALVTKILRSVLPNHFHYFGLWYALVYLLQGLVLVSIVRTFRKTTLLETLLISLIGTGTPFFLYRFGHTALSSHFLILLSFLFYFRNLKKLVTTKRTLIYFILLEILAVLIHPYLMIMTLFIYGAWFITTILTSKENRIQNTGIFFLDCCCCILSCGHRDIFHPRTRKGLSV